MTDNQLITKFLDKELSKEEIETFRGKFLTNKNFAAEVRKNLDIIVAIKTIAELEAR
jgi:hypothetical protein